MSPQDYEIAKELIMNSSKFSNFQGSKEETLICAAEEYLAIKFPPTYRTFLKEFGAGGLGSFEIYGLVNDNFINSGIPDVVWLTAKWRKELRLPDHLIPVYGLGDGEYYCLDLKASNGAEAKVVAFVPGFSSPTQALDVIASDFGELLLLLVNQELS